MKYRIQVKTNSKFSEVIKKENNVLHVKINALPIDGKANEKLIEILSKYFSTTKNNVEIITGFTSKIKIIEVKNK